MTSFSLLMLVVLWYVVGVASYIHFERKYNDVTLHRMLSEGLIVAFAGPITFIAWYGLEKPKESKILFKKKGGA